MDNYEDKSKLANRFTEVCARFLDLYDQQAEGKYPPYNHERWMVRYLGRADSELPPSMIEFNVFRPQVDLMVSQLMMAFDDDVWEAATKPLFIKDKQS